MPVSPVWNLQIKWHQSQEKRCQTSLKNNGNRKVYLISDAITFMKLPFTTIPFSGHFWCFKADFKCHSKRLKSDQCILVLLCSLEVTSNKRPVLKLKKCQRSVKSAVSKLQWTAVGRRIILSRRWSFVAFSWKKKIWFVWQRRERMLTGNCCCMELKLRLFEWQMASLWSRIKIWTKHNLPLRSKTRFIPNVVW